MVQVINNKADTALRRRSWRMSPSAMEPASAASALKASTTATLETAAGGALGATALGPAGELLTACRTALGKSSSLGAVAGIEGRMLGGEMAGAGGSAELPGAQVGALRQNLGTSLLSNGARRPTLTAGTVRPDARMSRETVRGRTRLSAPVGRGRRNLASSPAGCCAGAAWLEAAVVPAGGGSSYLAAKALAD